MPKSSRRVLRLLAVVVAVGLSLPVATSLVSGAAGRDFPRCIHACNEARKACDARCATDCTALYPNNTGLRQACVSACKGVCAGQSDDCKLACKVTPPPPSGSEP